MGLDSVEKKPNPLMDLDSVEKKPNPPRKVRFPPKAPPPKPRKPAAAKTEAIDDYETAKAKEALMKRIKEQSESRKPKIEKKSEPQRIIFGQISGNNGYQGTLKDDKEYEYKEPWNYYSYYPTTVPLRRPYSGNPDLLDAEEFGEQPAFDETKINTAMELGLMEESSEPRMLFLQLPRIMPETKRASAQASTSESAIPPSGTAPPVERPCSLNELPAGFMGKMVVYKSGKVKLKLGDTLYDVNTGSDCIFAQDVVAINTAEKHCCVVGELGKCAIVTPDIDSILDSQSDLI